MDRTGLTSISQAGWGAKVGEIAPLVSIVVVTYNAPEYTRLCLEGVLTRTRTPFELIVVDNLPSNPFTYEAVMSLRAEDHRVRYEVEPVPGAAPARNRGLSSAHGSVVAFTDGENTKGRSLQQFQEAYAALPEDVRGIPVFMVLFGEAKDDDLKALVKTTGGKVFDARKTPLYAVFKDIRAYQ